ncbi:hypothetical protein DVH24_022927 [Malus domestica]|uniref:Uncharacterized protein n=1 Tax=Malus domestica TaxID=3750 RepID=A0A498KUY4_MALDO|nr:hypothetical protein DVH24_022927 [Malus domestica]
MPPYKEQKLDSKSRELLTWALVKVSQLGDRVIAFHVLVYDSFCNLKQVDLKLKICRGTLIKKILVREANWYTASKRMLSSKLR